MFNRKFKFHKQSIREILDDILNLNDRVGNRFFNKISLQEAEYTLENTKSKLKNWLNQLELSDESFRKQVFRKFKKDLDAIDRGILKIEGKLKKRGRQPNNEPTSIVGGEGGVTVSLVEEQNMVNEITSFPINESIKYPVKLKNPEGVVSDFYQETEITRSVFNTIRKVHARLLDPISGRLDPPTKKVIFVWKFNLNVFHQKGKGVVSVPIQLRGGRLKGQIVDGDLVELQGQWKWRNGDIIEVTKVYSKTRNCYVKATGSAVMSY